jgi:hypothetical protein
VPQDEIKMTRHTDHDGDLLLSSGSVQPLGTLLLDKKRDRVLVQSPRSPPPERKLQLQVARFHLRHAAAEKALALAKLSSSLTSLRCIGARDHGSREGWICGKVLC